MVCLIRQIFLSFSFSSLKADQVRNKVVDQVSLTLALLLHLQCDGNMWQSLIVRVLGWRFRQLLRDDVLADFELVISHFARYITEVVIQYHYDVLTVFTR
jgi:hypothetical protein